VKVMYDRWQVVWPPWGSVFCVKNGNDDSSVCEGKRRINHVLGAKHKAHD
jgi:hypothetical protein